MGVDCFVCDRDIKSKLIFPKKVKENKTYTYDKNGNQIQVSDSVSNTVTTSTYDPAGQLSKYVKKENGTTTLTQTNKYNGSGARIQKTENGESIKYFYSQGSVLYTKDEDGKDTAFNLMGVSGNVIATARNENNKESYYYYHKDPAGSISNLRDADGASVVSYQYTDFGETSIYGDTDFYNEICYNESIYDKNTGLYYLNARYYNPEDGRFITRDSYRGDASRPSTLHLYAYCANNPVNYEDPSGHFAISRIVGGIIGAVAGAYVGSKIAKKTKATGWKKVAIIAGCTLAGGAVGAIAGPKVAKVAKKAASYVKRKLPSKKQVYSAAKKTVNRVKASVKKKVSKAKQVVSKGKKAKTVSKTSISKSKTGGVVKKKPNQVHHFATNKSKKYTHQFENITKKYNLDLDGDWNKQLMSHQGRHPNAYHDYILDNMQKFDKIASGDTDRFLKLFGQMKTKIINNPEMLYKNYWIK